MTFAPKASLSISKQRGFWLRCFLARTRVIRNIVLAAASMMTMIVPAQAQIAAPTPYHLARLRGIFVDAKGHPIAGAAVTLDRDDRVFYSTTTDAAGKFEIRHAFGHYWLHVDKKGYSTVSREVIVGLEMLTYLHSQTLYVIAGPGACSDDCSSVFTSRGKFDHAIRKNTGHYD
jgi:hypothetical protein